jgi:hypothetical protein
MLRRNQAQRIAPSDSRKPWYILNANESPDNTCYYDPEKRRIICDESRRKPAPPVPPIPPVPPDDPNGPPPPDWPPGEDWPPEEPEPYPYPPQPKPPNPAETVGKLLGQLLNSVADALIGGPAYAEPSPAPELIYQSERSPQRRVTVHPIPLQPLPEPSVPPSNILKNAAQQTLNILHDAQHQRMLEEARQLHETGQGRPDLVASLMDAYGPAQMTPLPPPRQNLPTEYDTYNPPVDPSVQQAFANLLTPPSGAGTPFIPEDTGLIAANLSNAQKPVDVNTYLRRQQERAMAEAHWQSQRALATEQAETERLKQNLLRMQQQVLAQGQQQSVAANPYERSNTAYEFLGNDYSALDKTTSAQRDAQALFGKYDWHSKIQQQLPLTDSELKQMFHDFELKRYSRDSWERSVVRQAEMEVKRQLAWNMSQGPYALRHKDDYIIIGEQAYGTKEASRAAIRDLDYFQEHDKHLPPLPYPATPDLKKQYYPDVTQKVQKTLSEIRKEIEQAAPVQRDYLVLSKFPNNGDWDLQVNHGLPGQVLELNLHATEILKDSSGKAKTRDQYALFKGEIRRAGYISNYAFGYGMAAVGYPVQFTELAGHGAAIAGGNDGDNPEDIKAMKEGWRAYWEESPK